MITFIIFTHFGLTGTTTTTYGTGTHGPVIPFADSYLRSQLKCGGLQTNHKFMNIINVWKCVYRVSVFWIASKQLFRG